MSTEHVQHSCAVVLHLLVCLPSLVACGMCRLRYRVSPPFVFLVCWLLCLCRAHAPVRET